LVNIAASSQTTRTIIQQALIIFFTSGSTRFHLITKLQAGRGLREFLSYMWLTHIAVVMKFSYTSFTHAFCGENGFDEKDQSPLFGCPAAGPTLETLRFVN
jgi:hypothetical protein